MPTFVPTRTDDPAAERLLDEYFSARALGFTTHAGGYRITHPDPAAFIPPAGVFVVVRDDEGQGLGCGGIRRIDDIDDKATFEVKHVWLRDAARGRGWSRMLLAELEARATGMGAQQMVLDTNESLTAAQHLYRTSGYAEIAPYNDNKNATHWFGKRLS